MISLQKGQKVNLKKEDQTLELLQVGLGWDTRTDLDSMAFLFDVQGKLRKTVCYSEKSHKGISLNGDNITGKGDGDDEIITVDLTKLPDWVQKISFGANIFAAKAKLWGVKDFSKVQGAYIRIVNARTNVELCRYPLTNVAKGFTAFHFSDLIRTNTGEWEFIAVGRGMNGSISEIGKQIERESGNF